MTDDERLAKRIEDIKAMTPSAVSEEIMEDFRRAIAWLEELQVRRSRETVPQFLWQMPNGQRWYIPASWVDQGIPGHKIEEKIPAIGGSA